jgi:predicted hydrocarbon binding protein
MIYVTFFFTPSAQGVAMSDRKYPFLWGLLGDLREGRPNLGPMARLEIYRLMQFTLRDVLEQHFGAVAADDLFREAGHLAGKEFYENVIGPQPDLGEFVKRVQDALKEMGIGLLRMEQADLKEWKFVLTVSEDLDCSGLPETGHGACVYDEGFLSGLLEAFSGRNFRVREIDCWCTGDRTCRFSAEATTG